MSHFTDCFASSDSTRMPSYSPSSTSSLLDPAVLNTAVPYNLFDTNNYQQVPWSYDGSSNTDGSYPAALFGSPPGQTQPVVEGAVLHCSSPPTVQLHAYSLSSPPRSPCGPVTYVHGGALAAPRPVSSSPPLIGRAWPATLQTPVFSPVFTSELPPQTPSEILHRPQMAPKVPPQKGRKTFHCLQPGCEMKFPKRNALDQHMRSHTGERPEVCAWCTRAFSLKCNLRRHWRTCKTKKAFDAANVIKKDPSNSPPAYDQSPSPDASSPSIAVVDPTSHSSSSAATFASPPNFWSPSVNVPGYQPTVDVHLFQNPFAPYFAPPLVQAQL